jgi:3-oxoacyl-[acyl-carrier-protein] synthase II
MTKKNRVVVTGMGVVSCFGSNVDTFYENLLAGKSGIVPIEEFPCSHYPTRFAGCIRNFDPQDYIEKKQARRIDLFISYGMVAGKKALEHAGFDLNDLSSLDKTRCGVILGSGMGGLKAFHDGVLTIHEKGFKRLTPFFIPYIITNMAGALLAIDIGFMGPNYSISTACATANFCFVSAANHIMNGQADLIVCGGTEAPIGHPGIAGFVACKALSERNNDPQRASRPWDKNRDGFVIGEGAGVLVLESLEHAQKRGANILCEYLGGSTSCDAYHMTDPRADGLGASLCIEQAIKNSGIPKETINYINAHATSTLAGDIAEVNALKNVFKDHIYKMKMNATKSMIGHCLGAASGVEAIATIKAITTGYLHPTINITDPEPIIKGIDVVADTKQAFNVDVAISNSFGFGGHNSCVVLGRFKG